jgi:hypothetical protein
MCSTYKESKYHHSGELERNTVGGNPRSLEFSEGKDVTEVTSQEAQELVREEGTHRVAKELGKVFHQPVLIR